MMESSGKVPWTRVVKIGGSLLEYDRLAPSLRQWLSQQSPALTILLVGGGKLADAIRDFDRQLGLGEETCHWLCIHVMSVTARLLAAILPEANTITDFRDLMSLHNQYQNHATTGITKPIIFESDDLLRNHESGLSGVRLPHSWLATSDAIAARLATILTAQELVLLKSALPAPRSTLQDAVAMGYVDAHFPLAGQSVPTVRCVNLCGLEFPETTLRRPVRPRNDL